MLNDRSWLTAGAYVGRASARELCHENTANLSRHFRRKTRVHRVTRKYLIILDRMYFNYDITDERLFCYRTERDKINFQEKIDIQRIFYEYIMNRLPKN